MVFRSLLVITLGIGLAGVFAWLLGVSGGEGDGWRTYRNDRYGYQVRFPPDWSIATRTVENTADFEAQSVTLVSRAGRVLIAVNFQGGLCETGQRHERRDITVSGIQGLHLECYADSCPDAPMPACQPEPYQIVRYFDGAKGKLNYAAITYAVSNQSDSGIATLRRIVESFRFVE